MNKPEQAKEFIIGLPLAQDILNYFMQSNLNYKQWLVVAPLIQGLANLKPHFSSEEAKNEGE